MLERIAINNEVMVAVANHKPTIIDQKVGKSMLSMWAESIKRAGVTNFMIIAIDDKAAEWCEAMAVPYWRTDPVLMAAGLADGGAISALKYQLIKPQLQLGYSVLLADTDIVTLQNPFKHLYRDSDLESMTDAFDEQSAIGWHQALEDPQAAWNRLAHTFKVLTLNSGLFFVRPSERTIRLMDRITEHLKHYKDWDQVIYNQDVWRPAHAGFSGFRLKLRVMEVNDFVNSKRLFKYMRFEPKYSNHTPVMVHINYHPDKLDRMMAVWARYIDGDVHALDHFTVGAPMFPAPPSPPPLPPPPSPGHR